MEASNVLEFEFKTGKVIIDYTKCIAPTCGFACIKADRFYGKSVLEIVKGKPVLAVTPNEARHLCNECLACEIHCQLYGGNAIQIELPLFGLREYRAQFKRSCRGGKHGYSDR
jgi:hypothetical protein